MPLLQLYAHNLYFFPIIMTDVAKAFAAVRLRDATVRGISGLWGKRRRRNEALESSVRVAEATIVRTTVIEDDWVLCDAIDGTDPVVENIPAPLRPKKTAPLLPLRSMARPTVQETRAEGRTVTASGQDLDLRQFSGKQGGTSQAECMPVILHDYH